MTDGLRNIITGISEATERNLIQTTLNFLRKSKNASGKIKESKLINKEDEVIYLTNFANQHKIWINSLDDRLYIGEGAEQKVYLNEDGKNVTKINNLIFYLSWEDYLISLLIHNYLFPSTAYTFLGFLVKDEILHSIVQQPFIVSTEPTKLEDVRIFLEMNGFIHKKNNDYYNTNLGIILEDLHDENVLTNQGVFFFIDTAIYLL